MRTGALGHQFGRGVEIHGAGRATLSAQEEGDLLLGYAVEPGDEGLPLVAIAPQPPQHPQEDLAGDVLGRRRRAHAKEHVAVDGVEVRAVESLDGAFLAPAGGLHQALLATALALSHLDVGEQVRGRSGVAGSVGDSGGAGGSTGHGFGPICRGVRVGVAHGVWSRPPQGCV